MKCKYDCYESPTTTYICCHECKDKDTCNQVCKENYETCKNVMRDVDNESRD